MDRRVARWAVVIGSSVALLSTSAWAVEEDNVGQDFTRPRRRVELRVEYTESVKGASSETYILRHELRRELNRRDKIAFRIDLPLVANDTTTPENPRGQSGVGTGDLLLQVVFLHEVTKRQAFGVGAQLIVPTASEARYGDGWWRIVPTVGYRWFIPGIWKDSFFVLALRYDIGFVGDPSRPRVNVLEWAPTLNITFPRRWFFTLYPDTNMQYDFNGGGLFIPFDGMVGKVWGGKVVTSVEVLARMFGDESQAPYRWRIQGRVGFLF